MDPNVHMARIYGAYEVRMEAWRIRMGIRIGSLENSTPGRLERVFY